jgi:hypothetical protein
MSGGIPSTLTIGKSAIVANPTRFDIIDSELPLDPAVSTLS